MMTGTGDSSDRSPRPEYDADYHYRKGTQITFEYHVLTEQGYLDLDEPEVCPRCGSAQTRLTHAEGPTVTRTGRKVAGSLHV